MLSLTVGSPGETPHPPDPGTPGVAVWRENDGRLAAWGGSDDLGHWLAFPGVGVFRFGIGREEVIAFPERTASMSAVHDTFRRSVLPMALQARGQQVLHASAVHGPAGVVAFCAVSETGKSTVAFALARRGYRLWADDAVAFAVTPEQVVAIPLPFVLRLRPSSASHFGVEEGAADVQVPEAAPLTAICVMEPSANEDEHPIDPLQGAEAFPSILAHAYSFSLAEPARNRQTVETYLSLAQRVPAYRVRLTRGLDRLPRVLDALEATAFRPRREPA